MKRCSKCGLEKPTESFYTGQRWCRTCALIHQRAERDGRRAGQIPLRSLTEKPCFRCAQVKGRAAFNKNMARADGLDHLCRTCRQRRQARYTKGTRVPTDFARIPAEVLAYAAGFIDGEGSFRLFKGRGALVTSLSVSNTNLPVLTWLQEKFGGSIHNHRAATSIWKKCWVWRCSTLRTRGLAKALLPFLRVKRRHAELIIAFYAAIQAYKEQHPGGLQMENLKNPLRHIADELRALNRRGPPPP